jgi:hypothetical protein
MPDTLRTLTTLGARVRYTWALGAWHYTRCGIPSHTGGWRMAAMTLTSCG